MLNILEQGYSGRFLNCCKAIDFEKKLLFFISNKSFNTEGDKQIVFI